MLCPGCSESKENAGEVRMEEKQLSCLHACRCLRSHRMGAARPSQMTQMDMAEGRALLHLCWSRTEGMVMGGCWRSLPAAL